MIEINNQNLNIRALANEEEYNSFYSYYKFGLNFDSHLAPKQLHVDKGSSI